MKKRSASFLRLWVVLTLAVALMFCVGIAAFSEGSVAETEKECYLPGDMNADGEFDNKDAIYVLYYSFFSEDYPLAHMDDADVDGNNGVDNKDAVALLYELLEQDSDYGKTKHDFYNPAWSWTDTEDGVRASVALQCACGAEHNVSVTVTEDTDAGVSATCTTGGKAVYHAKVEGYDFADTYTKLLPATGHSLSDVQYDENRHYQVCSVEGCGAEQNVASHKWAKDGEPSEATCKVASVQNYKCEDCAATKSEELGLAECDYQYVEDVLTEGHTSCYYAKKYVCSVCEDKKLAEAYESHSYVTVITKEATCSQEGEKVTKCENCGDISATETVAKNDSHTWDNGVTENGVITYTCDGCSETKTAVAAAEDGSVSKEALQSAQEVEVGNTTMELNDAAKGSLPDSVQITVDTVSKDKLNLSDEQKEQIGSNTVYDFSMTSGGENVAFEGSITITLPYTLSEGEDINSIEVWYVSDSGEVVSQDATYSNGYITFTTTHFSYYTVTRLTPAERCAKFGHINNEIVVAPTCTEGGYTYTLCQRCGAKGEAYDLVKETGHSYKLFGDPTEATCVSFGVATYCCETCKHAYSDVTPALGHSMQENVTDATCSASGKKVITCSRCDLAPQEETIAQLSHDYQLESTVAATCTAGGYELHKCKNCDATVQKNATPATGHKHDADHAEWTWKSHKDAPVVKASCTNSGCDYVKELKPVTTVKDASCESAGSASAVISYNGVKFERNIEGEAAKDHAWSEKWTVTDEGHYRQCTRAKCSKTEKVAEHTYDDGMTKVANSCFTEGQKVFTCTVCKHEKQEAIPAIGSHSYDQGAVTKQASCTEDGLKIFTCAVCADNYSEVLKATGHNFVDRVCTSCGATDGCTHEMEAVEIINLAEYGFCEGEVVVLRCPCGQESSQDINVSCQWMPAAGDEKYYAYQCANCAGRIEQTLLVEEQLTTCEFEQTWNWSLVNAEGTEVYSYLWYGFRDEHDYDLNYELLGDSCEDGVQVTGACSVCGDEYHGFMTGHGVDLMEEYDLADFGMCGGYVEVYSCPCGQEGWTNWDNACEMQHVETADGVEHWQCINCSAEFYMAQAIEPSGECQIKVKQTTTICKEGMEDICVEEIWWQSTHTWLTTLALKEGATTCDEGYIVNRVCSECGATSSWEGTGCTYYMVSQEAVVEGDAYCGSVYLQSSSCACGKLQRQNVSVPCSVEWTQMEDGTYAYVCATCGLYFTETYINQAVEGEPCLKIRGWKYTFYAPDGTYLNEAAAVRTQENHVMEYTFDLVNTTCDEGYYANGKCIYCDATSRSELMTGCQRWMTEKTEVVNNSAYCTRVYATKSSCACGAKVDATFYHNGNCNWNWQYVENLGHYADVCATCGLYYTGGQTNTPAEEGPICKYNRSETRTYYNSNNEVVGAYTLEGATYRHTCTYTFTMRGTTCEEGYYLHGTCVYCGALEEAYTRGCGGHLVEQIVALDDAAYCTKVIKRVYNCPCGAARSEQVSIEGDCQWSREYDEDLGYYVSVCSVCGLRRVTLYYMAGISGEPACHRNRVYMYTFYGANKEVVASVPCYTPFVDHWYIYTFTGNCEEGYTGTGACFFCGETGAVSGSGCSSYMTNAEVLYTDESGCGSNLYAVKYDCPCGDSHWEDVLMYGMCLFHDTDENGNPVCTKCGLTWMSENSYTAVEGKPECYQYKITLHSFYRNGELLGQVESKQEVQSHSTYTEFVLNEGATTCDEGYTVVKRCEYCDYKEESTGSGCVIYVVRDELLFSDDACGYKLYWRELNCACGANYDSFTVLEGNCETECVYVEHLKRYVWKCVTCGLYYDSTSVGAAVEGEAACRKQRTYTYSFYRDGELLGTAQRQTMVTQHSELATFKMNGTTCDEGYTVYWKCQYCGVTSESTGSGCDMFAIRCDSLYQDNGACGFEIARYEYSCPCGAEKWAYNSRGGNCQMNWQYVESLDRYMGVCATCGIGYYESSTTTPIEGETCKVNRVTTLYFYRDGALLKESSYQTVDESHSTTTQFVLQGSSCTDGYTRSWKCINCGEITGTDETVYYEHSTDLIARYELTEYGMCGGNVRLYSCACGERGRLYRSNGCNWTWVDSYNGYGIQARYCADCNTYIYYGSEDQIDYANCVANCTYYFQIVRDDEVLLDLVCNDSNERHTTLMVGKQTLEDGSMEIYLQCKYCKQTETNTCEGSDCHNYYATNHVDLSAAGACGGELWQYECVVCGDRNFDWNDQCKFEQVSFSDQKINGVIHFYYTDVCSDCGLTRACEIYDETASGECKQCSYGIWTHSLGDTQIGVFYAEDIYTAHAEGVKTYQLMDGAKTCDDGVAVTETCTACGAKETYQIYYHESALQESIDLTAYGSKCGSYLERYGCACGERTQRYSFSDKECDMGCQDTDLWIENALNGEYQHLQGYWEVIKSYAYIYTCAVTDPQCAMQVRMAEYWLQEGCIATQYQTWQLGYNAADGTYLREITIATGEKSTLHSITETSETVTLDDGGSKTTTSYVCSNCASSGIEESYYYADGTYKRVSVVTNTLDDGNYRYESTTWEHGYLDSRAKGALETLYLYEWTDADGNTGWARQDFTYDLDNCSRTYTNTYSDGGSDSHTNTHFQGQYNACWETEPTCTQGGVWLERYLCAFCEKENGRYTYDRDPYGHSWNWSEEKQTYVCSVCSLENSNGADGSIVVGDLTAEYGENTNYVVGYWNRGNVEFIVRVGVILEDVTDSDNEVVLSDLSATYMTKETDGICAVAFNQAAVDAAAAAAIADAGYTGSWAIRITFVPVNGEDTLDYAITFDSRTA